MALKEAYAVKTKIGDNALTLAADAGESLLVKAITVSRPTGTHATIKTDKTTVGYWRVFGIPGGHLYPPRGYPETTYFSPRPNLLAFLLAAGIFKGYPIAEGETMVLSGIATANAVQVVEYEIYDAGDIKATDPNGSKSSEYFFMNYGRYSTTLADGENLFATVQSPAEFPAFPFGATCPQGKRITLHGIAFSPIAVSSTGETNRQGTEYVKLVREREVLFCEDRNGIPAHHRAAASNATDFRYGVGPFGNNTLMDNRPPFMFPKPLEFRGGEELGVYVTTNVISGSANMSASKTEIALIETVQPE